MSNRRFNTNEQSQSDLVYDPEYGTWDRPEADTNKSDTSSMRDVMNRHPHIVNTVRNIAVLALAGTVSYGGVHAAADLAGTKTGSLNTHDVSISTLWSDVVVDLPARIRKGF